MGWFICFLKFSLDRSLPKNIRINIDSIVFKFLYFLKVQCVFIRNNYDYSILVVNDELRAGNNIIINCS